MRPGDLLTCGIVPARIDSRRRCRATLVAHQRRSGKEFVYETLLSPITLKRTVLRNRIVMTAHRKAMDIPSLPGERELAYIARRAEGGAGLIVTEASAVHPTSYPYEFMPTPYDRAKIPSYERLARAVHNHDGTIFGQIYHCGAEAGNGFQSEQALWAPSELRGWGSQEIAHAMTKGEIDEVVEGFAKSALNLRDAGMDGVEIHAANGYLVQQFLSPMTNRRTDEYGGGLENRLRFAVEVIEAIRAATGPDFPIGLKLCLDERAPGGIELPEGLEIARHLDRLDEVDYMCATSGTHESRELYVPSSYVPAGEPARVYGAAAKAQISTPVLALAGVRWPDVAEEILAEGSGDLVGMLRALIADPDLPKRLAESDTDALRPCLGVNYCFRRATTQAPLRCAVNPAVGTETSDAEIMKRPIADGTSVAVVGAGPAGLEAACIAAERGARVLLFDASELIGGAVQEAAAFPGKSTYAMLIWYYKERLRRAGVELHLHTQLDDLGVLTDSVDVAIIASGARLEPTPWHDRNPDRDAVWDGPELFAGHWGDLLHRDVDGKRVVLIEAEPVDYVAATLATHLIAKRADLHIVTSFPSFASMVDGPASERVTRLLADHAVPVYTSSSVLPSREGAVRIHHGGLKQDLEVDGVSLVVATGARCSVSVPGAERFADGNRRLFYAGDCVAPRGIAQAVREGHDAAMTI